MTKNIVIHWFRQDLRLLDNPALVLAAEQGKVLPIYILDNDNAGDHAIGAASRCWLHHSLKSLNASLGGNLAVYKGNPLDIFKKIIAIHDVKAVYWNRCYEPWSMVRDQIIKEDLKFVNRYLEHSLSHGGLYWVTEMVGEPGMPAVPSLSTYY